ncbi:monocarboxylate transporter 9 [Elysia marginata]|uniref:Monocarboxylate transporter 9 n=1 Tax=Elysia marginata TaxID=1093978 RepID=A0AAV4ICY0_9GAST|nr:monocarboxylate transporter 9 [Elysia marginata]
MGVAPDGGWGWVIVFCSMLSHMLTVGGFLSLSVMYVHWLDEFSAGRGATSWIISVAVAVTYAIASKRYDTLKKCLIEHAQKGLIYVKTIQFTYEVKSLIHIVDNVFPMYGPI